MNNAVIYARYSSQGQNEQTIEGQVRVCTEFAEQRGFKVVKTYFDRAKTGTNDNRPDFQKMIAAASTGAFQYVIVYMFDRFARNRIDSIMYKQQLKNTGLKLYPRLNPFPMTRAANSTRCIWNGMRKNILSVYLSESATV